MNIWHYIIESLQKKAKTAITKLMTYDVVTYVTDSTAYIIETKSKYEREH